MQGTMFPQQVLSGYAAQTAGTTQTQAGATAVTAQFVDATVGNANDGFRLPNGTAGLRVAFKMPATAGRVYPPVGGTIDGGTVNVHVAPTVSKTSLFLCLDGLNWRLLGNFA